MAGFFCLALAGGGGQSPGVLVAGYLWNERSTANPLYNDIRYNIKIRYNISPTCTKISGSCIFFFIDSPMLFFGKTYVLDILPPSYFRIGRRLGREFFAIKHLKRA